MKPLATAAVCAALALLICRGGPNADGGGTATCPEGGTYALDGYDSRNAQGDRRDLVGGPVLRRIGDAWLIVNSSGLTRRRRGRIGLERVDQLAAQIGKLVADPATRDKLTTISLEPLPGSTPDSFAAYVRTEVDRWADIVKNSGAELE